MISSGFPVLSGPGSRRFRRPPLLPTDMRGKKHVDDRRVPSRIVHALRCGGRRTDCADIHGPKKTLCNRFVRRAARGYGKVSSALLQALRIRLTGCSSTVPASGFIAAPAAEKGALAPMPPWYRPHQRRTQHRAPRRPRPQGPPVFLSIASCSRRPETCMIARSHSAASRPCRHPPNLSPAKAVTAGNCANSLKIARTVTPAVTVAEVRQSAAGSRRTGPLAPRPRPTGT